MDRRVLAHFGGDMSRANISPRKRDQILARYADAVGGAAGEPERTSRGLAAAAAADVSPDGAARPTRRPSPEGSPAAPPSTRRTAPTADNSDEPLVWRCTGCGYRYDVVAGEEREGFAAGTAWSEIPDPWCCPDCGVRDKVDFVPAESAVTG
jgi:alkane 1-monooxygenase